MREPANSPAPDIAEPSGRETIGTERVNGPIVVPPNQPSSGDPGASSGCVTVDPSLARAILRHPHRYYADVRTAAFPSGAVRGQLFGRFN